VREIWTEVFALFLGAELHFILELSKLK